MRKFFSNTRPWKSCFGLLVAGLLFVHGEAKAALLNGSLALSGINVSQNGANLAASTQINAVFVVTTNSGTGDYSAIPLLTIFIPATLDLTSLNTFTMSNATWGSFAANVVGNSILQQTSNFLDVLLSGIFTPGPGLAGFDPTDATVRVSINQSGRSLSEAITLNSAPVPEPGTLLLLGSGLVALVASRKQFTKR